MRSLVLSILLVSFPVLACPNLAGHYVNSAEEKQKVVQNGSSIRFGNAPVLFTDGQEHVASGTIEDFGTKIQIQYKYKVRCTNDSFIMESHETWVGYNFEDNHVLTFTKTPSGYTKTESSKYADPVDWRKID